jgi:hypothetical protein
MPGQQEGYSVWLILFAVGIGMDVLGVIITDPSWLRYGLIGVGILFLFTSVALIGRLQRSK